MNTNLKTWKAALWFAIILAVFFVADLLTKHFLFSTEDLGKTTYENPVFGIRPLAHDNSTVFSILNIDIPYEYRLSFNLCLAALFLVPILFSKSIAQNIALGIIVAGILGNTVDIMFTDGHIVKDIIFTPWWDRGTFNLADLFMVSGAVMLGIVLIVNGFRAPKKVELLNTPA